MVPQKETEHLSLGIPQKPIPYNINNPYQPSLRSKRFQSSYSAKVGAGAKKMEGGGGREREKRKRLPANPTILKNAPNCFHASMHLQFDSVSSK